MSPLLGTPDFTALDAPMLFPNLHTAWLFFSVSCSQPFVQGAFLAYPSLAQQLTLISADLCVP